MWLATSSGLNKINDDNTVSRYFKSNTNNLLLSENILIHYDNNGVLIGTDEGLNYLISIKIGLQVKKLEGKPILGIKKQNDKILFLTIQRFILFEAET